MDQPIDTLPVSLWRRLAAAFYDSLVVVALWFIATAIVMPFSRDAIAPDHPIAEFVYRLYLLAVGFAFFGGFWVRNGQTLGMLAWQVKVVRSNDGGPITWWQALKRYLAAWVACAAMLLAGEFIEYTEIKAKPLVILGHIGAFAVLILIVAVFRKAPLRFGGITWYDKVSGTRLVRTPSFTEISNPKN